MAAASPAVQIQSSQDQRSFSRAISVAPAPLLAAAFAYAGGIVLGRQVWNPASWWIVAAAALLLLSIGAWQRGTSWLSRGMALVNFLLIGALSFQLASASAPGWQNNSEFAALTDGHEAAITAHVIRTGVFQSGVVPRESADIETETLESEGKSYPLRFGIRASIYAAPAEMSEEEVAAGQELPRFSYGERLKFLARLRQPRNFMDAGGFDYREYLAQQNIFALASVRADRIELLPGRAGSRLGLWRSRVRTDLLEHIHRLWRGRDGELMAAMLLGDRTGVDRETTIDYQRTGAYHILVVAGLKIGILAFALLWIFNLARAPEWIATPLTIFAMILYAWITDANAPVVRATVMLAAYLAARLLYRERNPMNAVGLAALLLLAWEPRALFDASFQLTFLSILAIAGIALPITQRSSSQLRRALSQIDSSDYDFALSPKLVQFRLDLRLTKARLAQLAGARAATWYLIGGWRLALGTYEVLLLSAILQLALALPMAIYFHRAVTLGLPANAAVVPLHGLLLPAAGLALLASFVSPAWGEAMAWAAGALLHMTNFVVERLAHWRIENLWIGDLRVAAPGILTCLLASAALLFALWAARRRRAVVFASFTGLLGAAIWIALPISAAPAHAGSLEITAIDVGQGDSLLVVTPEGKTMLIDAGGELGAPGGSRFDMGEEVVSPALWARGITRLDAVALTHAHADHIGGMRAVIENFHPRELWLGPEPETPAMRALLREAEIEKVAVVRRKLGEKIAFGGAEFDVLGPPADWQVNPEKAQNNDSLVMLARYGNSSALLEGDAEKKIERELAEEDPAAELLKVGHHGSASSTTPELLDAVHPKLAVISVGYRNSFHHPRPEVLERLQAGGVRTWRTDTMGETTFVLDGKSIQAIPYF